MHVCCCYSVTQLCPALCDPTDCNPSGSSVHGIFQARIPEWVACLTPGDPPDPGLNPTFLASPALAGGFFTPGSPKFPCVVGKEL